MPSRKKEPRECAGFFRSTLSRSRCSGVGSAAERTATTLTRTRRTFLRFVHAQRTAVHLVAVESLDRGLRLARTHLNETESTGLARLAVVDQLYGINFPMALEEHLDILLSRGEGQVAHVDRRHPRHLAQYADCCRVGPLLGPRDFEKQVKASRHTFVCVALGYQRPAPSFVHRSNERGRCYSSIREAVNERRAECARASSNWA